MFKTIVCPACGDQASASGIVYCLCDKDFCVGQRCGASDLAATYLCSSCGSEGPTPEAREYSDRRLRDL